MKEEEKLTRFQMTQRHTELEVFFTCLRVTGRVDEVTDIGGEHILAEAVQLITDGVDEGQCLVLLTTIQRDVVGRTGVASTF